MAYTAFGGASTRLARLEARRGFDVAGAAADEGDDLAIQSIDPFAHPQCWRNPRMVSCVVSLCWVRESRCQSSEDLLRGPFVVLQSVRPGPSRMHHVPEWPLGVVSSSSGIVVSETFDKRVPDRRELFYKQGFAEGYPDIVHHQVPAEEIR